MARVKRCVLGRCTRGAVSYATVVVPLLWMVALWCTGFHSPQCCILCGVKVWCGARDACWVSWQAIHAQHCFRRTHAFSAHARASACASATLTHRLGASHVATHVLLCDPVPCSQPTCCTLSCMQLVVCCARAVCQQRIQSVGCVSYCVSSLGPGVHARQHCSDIWVVFCYTCTQFSGWFCTCTRELASHAPSTVSTAVTGHHACTCFGMCVS